MKRQENNKARTIREPNPLFRWEKRYSISKRRISPLSPITYRHKNDGIKHGRGASADRGFIKGGKRIPSTARRNPLTFPTVFLLIF